MRISELIAELEKVKAEHGNIPIIVEEKLLGYFEAYSVDIVDIDRYSSVDAPRGVAIS